MKYECKVCGVLCFDGTTEESLQYDIICHESGEYHKRNNYEMRIKTLEKELDLSIIDITHIKDRLIELERKK